MSCHRRAKSLVPKTPCRITRSRTGPNRMTSTIGSAKACPMLAADQGEGREPAGTRQITCDALNAEFVRLGAGAEVKRAPGPAAGEEVAAVLEGTARVRSGDEEYELSVGEGIVIPPGQGSCWSASSPALL